MLPAILDWNIVLSENMIWYGNINIMNQPIRIILSYFVCMIIMRLKICYIFKSKWMIY